MSQDADAIDTLVVNVAERSSEAVDAAFRQAYAAATDPNFNLGELQDTPLSTLTPEEKQATALKLAISLVGSDVTPAYLRNISRFLRLAADQMDEDAKRENK